MGTRERLIRDYHLLKGYSNAKERAAEIFGCTGQHFRGLMNDEETPEDRLEKMHDAVLNSAKEHQKKINNIVVKISE